LPRSNLDKYNTIIEKNTYYFVNYPFETVYESHIISIRDALLNLRHEIQIKGISKELFINLIRCKGIGLKALLALSGVSNEFFKRIITLIRIIDDPELSRLVERRKWVGSGSSDITEWTDIQIERLIQINPDFAQGMVNLFFEGSTIPFLTKTISTFELKKFSIAKLQFEIPELLDTLARYKEKGSYSGQSENNPETVIKTLLSKLHISFQKGDLKDLVKNAQATKRTMDFIIPNKTDPKIIIESSYLQTTSSGQGDKSKTEIAIRDLIKKHYPQAVFIGFIDGIGWYVRKGDLSRMVSAYDDVFTYHEDEMGRFETFLKQTLK
jgi:hypothetical protein